MKGRNFDSFIDGFLEYTSALPSPTAFKRWSAISCVAGALERKTWVNIRKQPLYPHLYTVLVGTPGVGKSEVTSLVERLWGALGAGLDGGHYLASTSLTSASLKDDLRDAERRIIRPKEVPSHITFNSLLVCANELTSFINAYDASFIGTLTDIYDGKPFKERRRYGKDTSFKLEHPQINILAGTTPSYLNDLLPEGAWDQGFTSRTIFVYSGDVQKRKLFSEDDDNNRELEQKLLADLKVIGKLYGKFTWTQEAKAAITDWDWKDGPPKPTHPKLQHYNTRRTVHLAKLCMISSASRGDDLVITLDDFEIARDWLASVEATMPDIFKAMRTGGEQKAIRELWYECWIEYNKHGKKAVPEALLIEFLQDRVAAHSVERILDLMCKSKIFEREYEKGATLYKPRAAPPA